MCFLIRFVYLFYTYLFPYFVFFNFWFLSAQNIQKPNTCHFGALAFTLSRFSTRSKAFCSVSYRCFNSCLNVLGLFSRNLHFPVFSAFYSQYLFLLSPLLYLASAILFFLHFFGYLRITIRLINSAYHIIRLHWIPCVLQLILSRETLFFPKMNLSLFDNVYKLFTTRFTWYSIIPRLCVIFLTRIIRVQSFRSGKFKFDPNNFCYGCRIPITYFRLEIQCSLLKRFLNCTIMWLFFTVEFRSIPRPA